MVKTAVILVGCLVVLAACGTAPRPRVAYDKAGVSETDRKRDQAQCSAAAVAPSRSDVTLGMMRIDRNVFDECMKSRGYTPRPVTS